MEGRNTIAQILESQSSTAEVLTIQQFLDKYAPSLRCDFVAAAAQEQHKQCGGSACPDADCDPETSLVLDYVIRKTLVVPCSERCKPLPCVRSPRVFQSLESLVDDAVFALLLRHERLRRVATQRDYGGAGGLRKNLLCLGYKIGGDSNDNNTCASVGGGVVVMTNLNHNVDYCKTSRLFRMWHACVGDDVMRMILMNCSVFVPVVCVSEPTKEDHRQQQQQKAARERVQCRGNYLQITGPPLRATGPKIAANSAGTAKVPETATDTTASGSKSSRKRKNPCYRADKDWDERSRQFLSSSAVLSRKDLFYQESYSPKVGLPASHLLNRSDVNPAMVLDALVELSDPTRPNRPRRRKRWRRVRDRGVPICHEMIRRHAQTDYHRLLDRHCPLPDFCRKGIIAHAVSLPDASASFCNASQVVAFVRAVLRSVLPPELLGTDKHDGNWNQLLDCHVDKFVRLRRYEELANKNVLGGMKVTKVAWLFAGRQSSKSASRSDHQSAQELLTRVLRWIFGQFVVPLLANCFYVTESEFSGRQVLYYRKPAWAVFRALSMKKLLAEQFVEISADKARDLLKSQEMGFSRLRLFPKETGVRPIATLSKREFVHVQEEPASKKRKIDTGRFAMSTNRILGDAFAVLKYEHSQQDDSFGAGVHGLHYFYPRYLELLEKRKEIGGPSVPLYFASVDIQHCYDTINQEHLLEVLERQILSEDDYIIQQFDLLHPFASLGRVFRKQNVLVGPPADFQPLTDSAVELAKERHNSVFVDRVSCSVKRKGALLKQIHEHLTSHLVVAKGRYGDRYLLQRNGIPQGSVLSTLLCNFYFGDVEKSLLPNHFPNAAGASIGNPTHCELLVRMVDDFLLITSDLTRLGTFLRAMYKGDPALGVSVNRDKTKVSVPVSFETDNESLCYLKPASEGKSSYFTWCGMAFNIESGEVCVDYTRFQSGRGGDVLTVDRVRQQGRSLAIAMKTFVRPRCSPILFHSVVNSRNTQRSNFYQLFVLAAVKTAEHLRSSGMLANVDSNLPFMDKCIDSTISYAHSLLAGRLSRGRLQLQRPVAFWLGLRAFADVFTMFPELRRLTTLLLDRLKALPVSKHVRIVAETASKSIDIKSLF
jgi:telomerase reverse transcriptase